MNSKKLTEYINSLGITNEEFAEHIGISFDTLKSWLYRKKEVPKNKVEFVLGKITNHKNYTENTQPIIELSKSNYLPALTDIKIPYYDIDFAGGWTTEELFSNQNPLFVITNPAFERSDFACNLYGDSVSDKIPSGAIIGLKNIDDWKTYFITDNLYGIITKNDLRTVKLVYRSSDKNNLILKSCPQNRESIEEEIPINFITKFFQIIAWEKFERLVN